MLHGASLLALIVLLVIFVAAVSGRGESPIVVRLGNVLYWGASLIAGLLGLIAAYAAVFGTGDDRLFIDAMLFVVAVIVWLVGRACRYVLAGR
jgi:hypothetical protein